MPNQDWTLVSESFPKDLWVSRVVASEHHKGRVYVTLNGYRWDDMQAYVYRSDDFGKTWQALVGGLPQSPVNVIREDPEYPNLLYLGNDLGAYVSVDGGTNWQPFAKGLTAVAVHDLVIQAEEKDLLLGTHGRSIYITDLEPLHTWMAAGKPNKLMVLEAPELKHNPAWGSKRTVWSKTNTPQVQWILWSDQASSYTAQILNSKGKTIYEWKGDFSYGINAIEYDLQRNLISKKDLPADDTNYYLEKGTYQLKITTNSSKIVETFPIK